MKFFPDPDNAKGNYSYDTFEDTIGGDPIFICRGLTYYIIPVINQGIYDLPSYNAGQTPIYLDRSYYFFEGVEELTESLSIREGNSFKGTSNNNFSLKSRTKTCQDYYIELEMGYNGQFFYGANWKVKAVQFGVLINEASKLSNDKHRKDSDSLSDVDKDFLLNRNQPELTEFISTLE